MMTDDQRFLFDLQGYLVLENVLAPERIERMRREMDVRDIQPPNEASIDYRFSGYFAWGDDFRSLIDEPPVLAVLEEMLGPKFRLDHAYGMAMKADLTVGKFGGLHHTAGMFQHGCYYVTHGAKMHNGLMVASFALTDAPPGSGGFCCIPGSHRVTYEMPAKYYRLEDNPLVRQVPCKAGDVILFTEALTHGTMPWTSAAKGERRSLLLKYCPHYMAWAQKPIANDIEGLTQRQKLLLEGAYVAGRAAVAV